MLKNTIADTKNREDNPFGQQESNQIKRPQTTYDVHPLIQKRWSPRSFSDQPVHEAQIQELIEAASWAASANNEQPWRYVYALKGTPGFEQLWDCSGAGKSALDKISSGADGGSEAEYIHKKREAQSLGRA